MTSRKQSQNGGGGEITHYTSSYTPVYHPPTSGGWTPPTVPATPPTIPTTPPVTPPTIPTTPPTTPPTIPTIPTIPTTPTTPGGGTDLSDGSGTTPIPGGLTTSNLEDLTAGAALTEEAASDWGMIAMLVSAAVAWYLNTR